MATALEFYKLWKRDKKLRFKQEDKPRPLPKLKKVKEQDPNRPF